MLPLNSLMKMIASYDSLEHACLTVADGDLCLTGKRADGVRYWHYPIMRLDSNVSAEALGASFLSAFDAADIIAKKNNGVPPPIEAPSVEEVKAETLAQVLGEMEDTVDAGSDNA